MTEQGSPAAELRVVDNAERKRFEGYVGDDLAGVVEYIPLTGKIIATHAEVEPDFEGQGVASRLVGLMVDRLRDDGRTMQPLCPYVTRWLRRHPEAADVVDRDTPH